MSQPTLFTLAASPPPAPGTNEPAIKEPAAVSPPPATSAKEQDTKEPAAADTQTARKRSAATFDYGRGRKIRTVRRDNGRHSFLVHFQDAVLYLSPVTYPSAADAASAGKTFLRNLPADWLQRRHPLNALDGQCHRCLERGKAVPAVDNGRSPLCRPCWQQLHPGQLEKWDEDR